MNYTDHVKKTEAPITPNLLLRLDQNARVIHALIGLQTEIGELAERRFKTTHKHNFKEEAGDLLYYAAILADVYGLDLERVITQARSPKVLVDDALVGIQAAVGSLADRVKRVVFYGNPQSEEGVFAELLEVLNFLAVLLNFNGVTWNEVLSANTAKLETRYKGGGFDAGNAVNRDLNAERAALGGNA